MFKRIFVIIILLLAMGTTSQADNWKIDVVHSSVGFSVRHLVISKVKGNFKSFSGNLQFDGKDLINSSVEFTVHTSSVNTENEDRDKHLQSPDFFNSEKYPSMTFKSKKVHVINGDGFKLTGDLT
ncbi:MAG: YceI family protein, partial [Candidatus Zixiibacteriota bacterium]